MIVTIKTDSGCFIQKAKVDCIEIEIQQGKSWFCDRIGKAELIGTVATVPYNVKPLSSPDRIRDISSTIPGTGPTIPTILKRGIQQAVPPDWLPPATEPSRWLPGKNNLDSRCRAW
jgi:hypothetical protein